MALRFHWSLSSVGDKFRGAKARTEMSGLFNFDEQAEFARAAEENGIDSLLMALGSYRPEPLVLSMALGMVTKKIKFMCAVRPGTISPTLFVQQVNSVSALTGGRITINLVTGNSPHELNYYGAFLEHDARYERADEFLTICDAFWKREAEVNFEGKYYKIEGGRLNTPFVSSERSSPEIFLGGNSELAEQLALKHANCLWRFADTPENLRPRIPPFLNKKVEVGLLMSILARPSREQAVADAYAMVETLRAQQTFGKAFSKNTDSISYRATLELAEKSESDWLTPTLWTGAIPYMGSTAIALVGTPEEIALAIMEYKSIGVSQFLFIGWPDLQEMKFFGKEVLPLIRKMEQEHETELQVAVRR